MLECGGGLAQDVITTVGQVFMLFHTESTPLLIYLCLDKATPLQTIITFQAFELRFKEFLSMKKSGGRPPPLPNIPRPDDPEYANYLFYILLFVFVFCLTKNHK